MASIKEAFGTSNQTITCSLASLANNGARASTVIDNSSNLFLDALVQLTVRSGPASTSTTGVVYVYVYATADGGTTYSDGATGSDADITLTSPNNVRLIGVINIVSNATSYKSSPMSVASAFGGILPEKWGIIVENRTGGTLDSTEGSHAKFYQGVYAQTI